MAPVCRTSATSPWQHDSSNYSGRPRRTTPCLCASVREPKTPAHHRQMVLSCGNREERKGERAKEPARERTNQGSEMAGEQRPTTTVTKGRGEGRKKPRTQRCYHSSDISAATRRQAYSLLKLRPRCPQEPAENNGARVWRRDSAVARNVDNARPRWDCKQSRSLQGRGPGSGKRTLYPPGQPPRCFPANRCRKHRKPCSALCQRIGILLLEPCPGRLRATDAPKSKTKGCRQGWIVPLAIESQKSLNRSRRRSWGEWLVS